MSLPANKDQTGNLPLVAEHIIMCLSRSLMFPTESKPEALEVRLTQSNRSLSFRLIETRMVMVILLEQ